MGKGESEEVRKEAWDIFRWASRDCQPQNYKEDAQLLWSTASQQGKTDMSDMQIPRARLVVLQTAAFTVHEARIPM